MAGMLWAMRTARWGLAAVLALGGCSGDQRGVRLVPDHGPQGGGQAVVLEGVEFPAGVAPIIYFGPRPAIGVVIEGPTRARMVTPQSETVGPVTVEVRWPEHSTKLEEKYTYEAQPGFVLQPEIGPL